MCTFSVSFAVSVVAALTTTGAVTLVTRSVYTSFARQTAVNLGCGRVIIALVTAVLLAGTWLGTLSYTAAGKSRCFYLDGVKEDHLDNMLKFMSVPDVA